jgi:hypothetical protein
MDLRGLRQRGQVMSAEQQPKTSIDYQQQRGAGWDVVDEAIAAYDEWMLDDDYDAVGKLAEIMLRMRARRDLYREGASEGSKT